MKLDGDEEKSVREAQDEIFIFVIWIKWNLMSGIMNKEK